jgi:ubiquinone/menaquinone biosynthesis C-methylase UbiE
MAGQRAASVYADFLLPHLTPMSRLVDLGCGDGELTLDLASSVGHVTGVDVDQDELDRASRAADELGVTNATFILGDVGALDIPDDDVDVVLAHSVLEALEHPDAAVAEMARIVRPGGLVAVASVDYGGLVLAGPQVDVVRRFYAVREQLWLSEGADPYLGRRLRGLLLGAGLHDVVASSTYICHGTARAVRQFGQGRAEDCQDDWYVDSALRHGLATGKEIEEMRRAWLEWSQAPTSYAAFCWCRALGWKG